MDDPMSIKTYTGKDHNILNEKDLESVNLYLDIVGRTGSQTKIGMKSILFQFFKCVNKDNIIDIDESDCFRYFDYLEEKNLKYSSKKTKRSRLNSFFKFYARKMRRTNPTYYNPIPELNECNFSGDKIISIEQQQKKLKDSIFTIEQLKNILKISKFGHPEKYFIAELLLTFCGMRISECVSIRLENINLEERYLMTGIEENCRKSNKHGNNPLYFCFPEEIKPILREYINNLKQNYPDNIWLFKGRNSKGYISQISFYRFLQTKFSIKTHTFRKTIETFQLRNKTPLHIVELLSNHVISSVVMKHYNIVSIKERRELYDEYLPTQYQEIISLLKKL